MQKWPIKRHASGWKRRRHNWWFAPQLVALYALVLAVAVTGLHFLHGSQAASAHGTGDYNNNGTVDISDLSKLLINYNKVSSTYDLTGDGKITIFDLSIILNNFGHQVSSGGNSGNVVSVSNAGQLTAALSNAKPGDTITLADGTYSGQFVSGKSGTAQALITLVGSRNAILNGGGQGSGYGFHLDGGGIAGGVQYWKLLGFTVTNAQKGIVFDNVQNSTVTNVSVHDVGEEGIHLRAFSSHNILQGNTVAKTGTQAQGFGEGIYVGSAVSNWGNYSNGQPDTSNDNQIIANTISFTGAENIDIKEGTHAGVIKNNILDGHGMCANTSQDCNSADSLIDMKGEGWQVTGNTGKYVHVSWSGQESDGFQVHVISKASGTGTGTNNVFGTNHLSDLGGYGFNIDSKAANTHATCDNVVTSAAKGFGNVTCR